MGIKMNSDEAEDPKFQFTDDGIRKIYLQMEQTIRHDMVKVLKSAAKAFEAEEISQTEARFRFYRIEREIKRICESMCERYEKERERQSIRSTMVENLRVQRLCDELGYPEQVKRYYTKIAQSEDPEWARTMLSSYAEGLEEKKKEREKHANDPKYPKNWVEMVLQRKEEFRRKDPGKFKPRTQPVLPTEHRTAGRGPTPFSVSTWRTCCGKATDRIRRGLHADVFDADVRLADDNHADQNADGQQLGKEDDMGDKEKPDHLSVDSDLD